MSCPDSIVIFLPQLSLPGCPVLEVLWAKLFFFFCELFSQLSSYKSNKICDYNIHALSTFTEFHSFTNHTERRLHLVVIQRVAIFLKMAFHAMLVRYIMGFFFASMTQSLLPASW
jgi:hypothetical protein